MAHQSARISPSASLQPRFVSMAAAAALLSGLAIGYLFPVSQSQTVQLPATAAPPISSAAMAGHPHAPTPAEMKQMADSQASRLLDQLRGDPKNPALLLQIGAIYYVAQQYQDAASWYGRAVEADPGNVAARNKLAGSLFREGDVDAAIGQLNRALRDDPKDANSLFNLGMIRLEGKGDARGALAAWQKLLRSNPQLSADRKAAVLRLIAGVMTNLNRQHPLEGARSHEQRRSKNE